MEMDLTALIRSKLSPTERYEELQLARQQTKLRSPGRPLTGAWYWVPQRTERGICWEVEAFYDGWEPSSDHVVIWPMVRRIVESNWNCSLKGIEYCSLPRGRVSQMILPRGTPPRFAIYHGNDSPLGPSGLLRVRECFQPPNDCQVLFDEHERCIAGQPEALSGALGYDLGVRGVEQSELDWDDE